MVHRGRGQWAGGCVRQSELMVFFWDGSHWESWKDCPLPETRSSAPCCISLYQGCCQGQSASPHWPRPIWEGLLGRSQNGAGDREWGTGLWPRVVTSNPMTAMLPPPAPAGCAEGAWVRAICE